MSSVSERIYAASPTLLQSVAISLYGLRVRRLRYGGDHGRLRQDVARSERLTEEGLRSLQTDRLRAMFRAAKKNVPFYSQSPHFERISEDRLDVESLPRMVPTLAKAVVRANPRDFHSRAFPQKDLVSIHTSGTTGTPLDIRVTPAAIQKNYAFFARMLSWYGVEPIRDRSATFLGRLFVPERQAGPPYWRYNYFMNNLLMSSYRLSQQTAPEYVRQLSEFRPQFIDAYPSAVHSLASHALRAGGAPLFQPRVVVTSSETVMPSQREVVEEAFRAPLRDHYGCAEMAALISQCEKGTYHVNPEYGIVEILRPDGSPCLPGEVGELCCTGLLNDAMPLIRYLPGDRAAFGSGKCDCGRAFPIVEALVGRVDDIIRTPDGREVGRLDPVFKGLDGIAEAQIVQETLFDIEILVVPAGPFDDDKKTQLERAVSKRLTPDMRVHVRTVAEIPRSAGGKFRAVVSKVPR
jgi:phenylacetate-CoA ligase